MAKNNDYKTVEELREEVRNQAISNFDIGDNGYHTVEEIRSAALQQGLIKQKPTQTTAQSTDARAHAVMQLSSNTPSYSETQSEINRIDQVRAGAQRRSRDTSAYDKALEMLKQYSNNSFGLNDSLSIADRQSLYKTKRNELESKMQELDRYALNPLTGPSGKQYYGANNLPESEIESVNALSQQIKSLENELRMYEKAYPNDFYEKYKSAEDYAEKSQQATTDNKLNDYLKAYGEETEAEHGLHGLFFARALEPLINPTYAEGYKNSWQQISDSEKQMYNYLLNTQGEDAANEYLGSLSEMLQKRTVQKEQKAIEGSKDFDLLIRNVSSVPDNIIGGVEGWVENTANQLAGNDITPYSPAHQRSLGAKAVRSKIAQDIDEATGGANIGGFSLGDLYQSGMSLADSTAGFYLLGPQAYTIAMGMGAAESTAKDLYDKGASPEQIFYLSTAAGTFEMFFETFSLDTLANNIIKGMLTNKATAVNFIKAGLMQAAVEGSEEVATDFANYISDILIMADKSERQQLIQNYRAEGYSQEEAERKATWDFVRQLWESFAGGFASGAIGGTSAYGVGATKALTKSDVFTPLKNYVDTKRFIKENASKIAGTEGGAESVMQKAGEIINDPNASGIDTLKKAYAQAQNAENTGRYDKAVARVSSEVDKHQQRDLFESGTKAYTSVISDTISKYAPDISGDLNAATEVAKKLMKSGSDSLNKSERATLQKYSMAIDKAVSEIKSGRATEELVSRTRKNAETAADTLEQTRLKAGITKVDDDYADTFTVNDDGKNYIVGQDSPINVQKFTGVSDKDMTAQLVDGRTVKASEISFDKDGGIATVLGGLLSIQKKFGKGTKMSPGFVNAVYNVYQAGEYGNNLSAFLYDVGEIYNAANTNTEYTPKVLSESAAAALRTEAEKIKDSTVSQKQKKVESKKTGTRREGTVIFEDGIDPAKLQGRRKLGVEAVENLAKATSITFHFYKSTKKGDVYTSRYCKTGENSPNGFYKNGEIYIDINAGANGEGLIMFTVSHELVHFMRDFSPESFDKYAKFLFENFASDHMILRRAVHLEMINHTNLTYDEAYEEVVARLSEAFLTDAHLADKSALLYKADKKVWNAVKDKLSDIVGRIKQYFGGMKPESELGRIGQSMAQKNEEILDRFVSAVRSASDNAAYIEKTTSLEKGNTSTQKNQDRFEDLLNDESIDYESMDATELLQAYVAAHKEAIDEVQQRERAAAEKQINEIIKKHQATRKGILTRRAKSQAKKSIRKKIRDLDKMLNRSTNEKTVKQGLRDVAGGMLQVADMLFPDTLTVDEMATEGVDDATPKEQAALDRYAKLLKSRAEGGITQEKRNNINAQLKYLRNNDLKDLISRERKRADAAQKAENSLFMKDALNKIRDAYRTIENSPEAYLCEAYDEELAKLIDNFKDEVGDKLAKNLTLGQLNDFNKIMRMLNHTIRTANSTFTNLAKATLKENGDAIMSELKAVRMTKEKKNKLALKLAHLGVNNLKPIYLIHYLGSETLEQAYWNLQHGELVFGSDMEQAKTFKKETEEKHHYKDFDFKKKIQYSSVSGRSFELDLDQRMWVYVVSRRQQGKRHLLEQGFTFESGEKAGRGKVHTGAINYPLSAETIDKIISDLSADERGYAEAMQEYLSSVMAEKGNEVSMKLYGVKLFNEDTYWSLTSNENYIPKGEEENKGQFKLKNSGFTKAINRKATNPIVMQGLEASWSNHVYEMSLYHGMTLPLEDMNRLYNYRVAGNEQSEGVKTIIEGGFSEDILSYISTLLKDLNGGVTQKLRTAGVEKLISLEKKGAVLANLSVIVQQPSSLFRAMAHISPKFFALPMGHTLINSVWAKRHIREWNDLKKYAPIAILKEMGGFDTSTGRGAIDYLSSGKRDSWVKRLSDGMDKVASWAPEVADQTAWVQIWNACQRETKAKYGYALGTEENKVKSAERFNEVIHLTQVYDSTLSRSGNMRSKQTMDKMLTAYMSEPLTYANMAFDMFIQAKRSGGFGKGAAIIARTSASIGMSILANALLRAIVVAMRDDDEDETFVDKYFQAFWEDIRDGVNPLNYLPVVKDVWSLAESKTNGYYGRKIERMDMSLIAKGIDTLSDIITKAAKGESYTANDIVDLIGTAAAFFGKPVKNVTRDVRAVINTYNVFFNSDYTKVKDEMGLAIPWKYQQKYDAAWAKGYSEKECKSKAEAAVREYIRDTIRPLYLEAWAARDYDGMATLRSYMYRTGYYSSLSNVDEILKGWRESKEAEDERAKTAEKRKKNN